MARPVALLVALVVAGAGLYALGRESADLDQARRDAKADGLREGLRLGRAAGVAEGRALEISQSGPAGARQAFERGYAAGANDAFGGFDGGWAFGVPYVITLRRGEGAVTYRIDSRRRLRPR